MFTWKCMLRNFEKLLPNLKKNENSDYAYMERFYTKIYIISFLKLSVKYYANSLKMSHRYLISYWRMLHLFYSIFTIYLFMFYILLFDYYLLFYYLFIILYFITYLIHSSLIFKIKRVFQDTLLFPKINKYG